MYTRPPAKHLPHQPPYQLCSFVSVIAPRPKGCLPRPSRQSAQVLCPPRTCDTHTAPALSEAKTVRVGQRASRWPRRRGLPLPGCHPGPPTLFCVPQLTLLPEGRVLEREKGHQQSTPTLQPVPALALADTSTQSHSQGSRTAPLRFRLGPRPHGQDPNGLPAERLKDPA